MLLFVGFQRIEIHAVAALAADIVSPVPDDAIFAGPLIAQKKGSNELSGDIPNK